MIIGLIITIWFLGSAAFTLGLCSAAARPMPQLQERRRHQPIRAKWSCHEKTEGIADIAVSARGISNSVAY